jgi:lysine-ketoglutarate reductase/saccharopine dehydrogenase-like protein (TIGR00300 family)
MDCAIVRETDGTLWVREPRRIPAGTPVAVGEAEDGSQGIVVHVDAFAPVERTAGAAFRFMSTPVSRERPVNYERLATLLHDEKARRGMIVWVIGPALVHARARADFVWLVEQGYVGAVLAGNAVAVHDIEAAIFGTTLGMTAMGDPLDQGHALHMRAINRVQRAGSIEAAVATGLVGEGIIHALVTREVPFVLTGSIRDDGPLPGVILDVTAAQDAMRRVTSRATFAVFVATALHAIAVGNMLPAFVDDPDGHALRPLPTICVDQTEFVVNKLRDRGTMHAFGVVTNAQDFLHVLRLYLERLERAS